MVLWAAESSLHFPSKHKKESPAQYCVPSMPSTAPIPITSSLQSDVKELFLSINELHMLGGSSYLTTRA